MVCFHVSLQKLHIQSVLMYIVYMNIIMLFVMCIIFLYYLLLGRNQKLFLTVSKAVPFFGLVGYLVFRPRLLLGVGADEGERGSGVRSDERGNSDNSD